MWNCKPLVQASVPLFVRTRRRFIMRFQSEKRLVWQFFGDWKMLSQKLGNWYILFWRPYISNVPDVQCTLSLRKTWCDKNKCIMKGVKNILKIYCHNKMATSGHLNPSRISLWMLWYNVFEVMVLFYFWTKERGKQTNFWVAVLLLNASQELVTVT